MGIIASCLLYLSSGLVWLREQACGARTQKRDNCNVRKCCLPYLLNCYVCLKIGV